MSNLSDECSTVDCVNDSDDECPVCFCTMSKTIKTTLPCNHSLCMDCILKLKSPKCVICRYDLKEILKPGKEKDDEELRRFLNYLLLFYARGIDVITPHVYESFLEYPFVRREVARITYSRAAAQFLRSPLIDGSQDDVDESDL